MTLPAWREEPIARPHDRKAFDCGEPAMNDFLVRYARQSHEQNAAKTFCAVDLASPQRVLGFYTVTPSAVTHAAVPPSLSRRLPQHEVAGFKLARLAVDRSVVGRGLGRQLLAAAALRCLRVSEQVGGTLMIIDAKSDRAAVWYESCGAERLRDRPLTLVMPLAPFAHELATTNLL